MRRCLPAVALLALLSAGCALIEPMASAPRPARETIEAFRLEGRIAVRRGGERFTANIDWRHDAQSDDMAVSGPLGQGLARLTAAGGAALLETADRKRFSAADLDGLTEQVFGTRLPVSGLGHWVLGRSAFGGAARLDAIGRLAGLTEQGWMIEYLRYEDDTPAALPALLQARREDVEVRLVIDSWSLASTSHPPASLPREGGDSGSLRSGSWKR